MTFPEFQNAFSNQGMEGMQRPGRSSALLGQGPCSSSRNTHGNIFKPFCRTKTPNKWKNFLVKYSSWEGGPREPILGPLNTSFEKQCKFASTLILIYSRDLYSTP